MCLFLFDPLLPEIPVDSPVILLKIHYMTKIEFYKKPEKFPPRQYRISYILLKFSGISMLLILCFFISGCTSYPERLPAAHFSLEEANRRGYETTMVKTTVQRDGKILSLASVYLREDKSRYIRHAILMRMDREGKPDPSFKTDELFSQLDIEIPEHPFLLIGEDGTILFHLIVKRYNHFGQFLRHDYTVFRLSPAGKLIEEHSINTGPYIRDLYCTPLPIVTQGTVSGYYLAGSFYKMGPGGQEFFHVLKLGRECSLDPAFSPVRGEKNIMEKIQPSLRSVTSEGGLVFVIEYGYGHKMEKEGIRLDFFRINPRGRIDPSFTKYTRPHMKRISRVHHYSLDSRGRLMACLRQGSIHYPGWDRLVLFDARGRAVPSFHFEERSPGKALSGTVPSTWYTDVIPLQNDGYLVMKVSSGKGVILHLDSRGVADPVFPGDFTEGEIDYKSSLVPGMEDEFFLQERDLWLFNANGTLQRQFRLCSGRDFQENVTLYEKMSHRAYVGCLGLIFRVFNIEIKAMP